MQIVCELIFWTLQKCCKYASQSCLLVKQHTLSLAPKVAKSCWQNTFAMQLKVQGEVEAMALSAIDHNGAMGGSFACWACEWS